MSETNHDFNYGKIYNFYKQESRRWIKGKNHGYVVGVGVCYCLSFALFQLYRMDYLHEKELIEVRFKLLDAIKLKFPERHSVFVQKIMNADQPLNVTEYYSLVSFNDHPETKFEDVLEVCRIARV